MFSRGAQIQSTRSTTLCTMTPDISGTQVWNLLMSPFWHLEFWSDSWIFG